MMIKRVIEIEEDTLKRIDEAESVPDMFGTDIVNGLNAIKYSKPYTEPLGDLICRSDALKAVDNRHKELLHDTEYLRKHCQIDLLGIKKHILAIQPANVIKPVKGDLISREALKEEASNLMGYVGSGMSPTMLIRNQVLDLIDNAQPVVVDCKNCDGYEAGYSAGVRDTERPQGEWKKTDNRWGLGAFQCNKCHLHYDLTTNFCPNCGADMRKGGAE